MKLFLTLAYFLTIHVQNKLFFKIKDNISYRVYVTYYGQFYRPLNLNGMTKSAVCCMDQTREDGHPHHTKKANLYKEPLGWEIDTI